MSGIRAGGAPCSMLRASVSDAIYKLERNWCGVRPGPATQAMAEWAFRARFGWGAIGRSFLEQSDLDKTLLGVSPIQLQIGNWR